MNFDYEDLNNLYGKLDRINENLEKQNQAPDKSGSGGSLGLLDWILNHIVGVLTIVFLPLLHLSVYGFGAFVAGLFGISPSVCTTISIVILVIIDIIVLLYYIRKLIHHFK